MVPAPELHPLLLHVARAVRWRRCIGGTDEPVDLGRIIIGLPEDTAVRECVALASQKDRLAGNTAARAAEMRSRAT